VTNLQLHHSNKPIENFSPEDMNAVESTKKEEAEHTPKAAAEPSFFFRDTAKQWCMCTENVGGTVQEILFPSSRGGGTTNDTKDDAPAGATKEDAPAGEAAAVVPTPKVGGEEPSTESSNEKNAQGEETMKQLEAAAEVIEVSRLREELASREEELMLKTKKIESLLITKETLLSTIDCTARKLIPSAIAMKDKEISNLKAEVETAKLEATKANEMVATMKDEHVSALAAKDVFIEKKEEEVKMAIDTMKKEYAAALAAKDQDIIAKDETIKTIDTLIVTKDNEITTKTQELEQSDKLIAQKDHEIASMSQRIVELDRDIITRNDEIAANRTCIMSMEIDLANATEKMNNIDCPLKHLETYLAVKVKRIASLEARLGDAAGEVGRDESAEALIQENVEEVEVSGDFDTATAPDVVQEGAIAEQDVSTVVAVGNKAVAEVIADKIEKQNIPVIDERDDMEVTLGGDEAVVVSSE